MAFDEPELEHLLNFVGYGRLDAPVWFLGMEEAGGGDDNLRAAEIRNGGGLRRGAPAAGITKHHEGRRVIQRTWRGMCVIMLKLAGRATDAESIRAYQAESLGRSGGETLLVELMPIPKPSVGAWEYAELLPQFGSREEYYQRVKPRRLAYLQGLIRENRPRMVVGYGKGYWVEYQALFSDVDFAAQGPFMVGRKPGLTVLLTDHFTARSMNGKWDEVVAVLKAS